MKSGDRDLLPSDDRLLGEDESLLALLFSAQPSKEGTNQSDYSIKTTSNQNTEGRVRFITKHANNH